MQNNANNNQAPNNLNNNQPNVNTNIVSRGMQFAGCVNSLVAVKCYVTAGLFDEQSEERRVFSIAGAVGTAAAITCFTVAGLTDNRREEDGERDMPYQALEMATKIIPNFR